MMPLPYENVSNPLVKPLQQVNLYDIPGPKKKFKIGLDYGTSYSAGAFCLCSNSEPPLTKGDIHPFYQLGGGSKGLPESSSAILYDGDSIFIGYDAEKHHKVGQGIIRRAKLGLDNRPETASAREALQKEIENLSNQRSSSIEVITDYLKIFFDGFKSRLIKVNYFRGDEIEMNCAVPSIWGDTARRSMVGAIRTAALRAGLDINPHVKLWPEAEAATEAYLRGVKRDRSAKDNPGLKSDDVFVVFDAGGGTVDLTTYVVQDTDTLTLKEVTDPSGALCGSSFLDEKFSEYIRKRVADSASLQQELKKTVIAKRLRQAEYEYSTEKKRGFKGTDQTYRFSFDDAPDSKHDGFEGNFMLVHSRDLIPIFKSVARKLWSLLKSQLDQAAEKGYNVKFILFTGGLSESPFMYDYLKKKVRRESLNPCSGKKIDFVQKRTEEYGVALGTIICSQKTEENASTRRISAKSIGIPYSQAYGSKYKYVETYKQEDPVDKNWYIENMMNWMTRKGHEQPLMQEMNLHQHIPLDAFGHYDIFVNVWASDYQCDKPYPLRYYEQISQPCYIWETVKFSLDMSIIKKKITHTTKRRTHRKATEKTGNNPVRRSKRIQQAKSAQNGDPACLDEVALPTEDVENNQSGSGSTLRQDSVSEDLISPPDEEGTELTAYYKIDYVFRMNFDGLSVDYKFYCPSIGYSKEGVIDLPDKFGFVGSELEAFTG